MAVIVRPRFNVNQIRKMIEQKKRSIYDAIANGLQVVGESFISNARDTDTYKDQTGNLRSSIGYVIYHNGAMLNEAFPGNNGEGVSKGRELADDIAGQYPSGFVLICVAGMDYAAALESKGYDVITNSSITALDDVRKMVRRLRSKVNKL